MNESEDVRVVRRELGHALKMARRAAGYSQAQLARKTGYARSTISTAESGSQNMARMFWERSDDALGPGVALTSGYDRLARHRPAGRPSLPASAATASGPREAPRSLNADTVAEAVDAYRRQGWRAEAAAGQVMLVCGDGVEALEVPRAAGVVAIRWWLHTGGIPDEIRGLPGLPGPQDALAVVAAGERFFFLVQAGACPWVGPGPAGARPERTAAGAVVRWHAGGSRIPAPPSLDGDGQSVVWAHPPPERLRLADPVILLDLLARAATLTGDQDQVLTLPGGVRVMLAPRPVLDCSVSKKKVT
jgi:transcriptional regulator with XRE-family HTH domain